MTGGSQRIALRSPKNPWDVVSPWRTVRRNLFRNNVGNLMYAHAVHRTLSTTGSVVESNRLATGLGEAARLNEECEAFVVPLANAFRPTFRTELDELSELIEQLTIPVVVIGVGVQLGLNQGAERLASVEDSVKRFVSAVLDRSATIGVRGEVTFDYLEGLGFDAVDIIGCPSMFLNGADLPATRPLDQLDSGSKVSIGMSQYIRPMGPILMNAIERYPDLTYVAQDKATLRLLLLGELPKGWRLSFVEPGAEQTADVPIHLNHPVFQRDLVRFFVDPLPWIDHLKTRDFWFGTRIHGSIAAIQGGAPVVLLAHDSRTLELARYHEIPHRLLKTVSPTVDPAQLYEQADYGPMHANHGDRFDTYARFLERNGLTHVFQPGESAAEFDQRCGSANYPEPVRAAIGNGTLQRRVRRDVTTLIALGRSVGSDADG